MNKATPEVFCMTRTMSELVQIACMLSPTLDQKHVVSLKRFAGEAQLIEMTINYLMYKGI